MDSPRIIAHLSTAILLLEIDRACFTPLFEDTGVNTTKRHHETAEAGQILITESSNQLIKDSFTCEQVKTVQLKKNHPATIYEVLS